VAISLPTSSTAYFCRVKLVGTKHLYSFTRVLLVIVLLKQALTSFCIILLQTTEGLDQTLE